MNQKEQTKTVMIVLHLKKPFGLHGSYKKYQRFEGKFILKLRLS